MKRLDERTVELTDMEQSAKGGFDQLLDLGTEIPEAVITIRKYYGDELSDEFYRWLAT